MYSIKALLTAMVIMGTVTTTQARDLYMAPPEGWMTTYERTASMTIRGQVAQGLFEKMPDSAIVKDPNATCAPTGIVKMAGGMLCTHWPPSKDSRNVGRHTTYECEMHLNLDSGELQPQNQREECGEDERFIQEERKKAKKKSYWIDR